VINHMCGGGGKGGEGVGTAGSRYNYYKLDYPGVPYSALDFNGPQNCFTPSGNIENYGQGTEVRNCRLSSPTDELSDLNLGNDYVAGKILEFMNKLIGFGVAGFRLDACKHMWPEHILRIVKGLHNLTSAHGFKEGARPFIYQEVIDLGGEGIGAAEYLHIGRVTEFKWGIELGKALRKEDGRKLANFYGPFMPDLSALVFVDNHDNQRGHGAGGPSIITFKEPRLYKIAQAFTLANVYGVTRVMSSYAWNEDWAGPPHDAEYNTLPVSVNKDLSCNDGWKCEHRWRQIYNMVKFRNVAYGEKMENYWSNGNSQVAWSRGVKAFIAINNDDGDLTADIPTGMPPGAYCDVISGNLVDGTCTGKTIVVGSGGTVRVDIGKSEDDPIVAIHAESKKAKL